MDFGAHFRVFSRRHQSLPFDDCRAMNRMNDDLDAVLMSGRRRTGKRPRVVFLGVKDAQSILQRSISSFLFRPTFRIFPFFCFLFFTEIKLSLTVVKFSSRTLFLSLFSEKVWYKEGHNGPLRPVRHLARSPCYRRALEKFEKRLSAMAAIRAP